MLCLTVLISLIIFLYFSLKRLLYKDLIREKNNYERLQYEYDKLIQENIRLKADNADLEKSVEGTIALYDITKDIRKILDEDKIFNLFRERLNEYIKVGDCQFLKAGADLSAYNKYTVLPLMIGEAVIGYLAASDIEEEDSNKFHILAQQFLLGIKGAYLFRRVQELTIIDSLTGVFNRRYFLERFDEEIKRSKNFRLKLSFLMIDIDHFKEYNDQYGHLVGDAILRETVKTIKANIREIDFMGRYGGEELSVILTETDKGHARYAAERIRQAIETSRIAVYDEELKTTVSIGISTFPDDTIEASALLDRADGALYRAKQMGRNQVCVYVR